MPTFTLMVMGVCASGCVGVFAQDGSSVSVGPHAGGALVRAVELPPEGAGYQVAPAWRARGRQFTTDEVARWLLGAFRRVHESAARSRAFLGDLSGRGGGRSDEHRSHGSGRDVDIFFYAVDLEGRPFEPRTAAMLRFGADGWAWRWSPALRGRRVRDPLPLARVDTRRTWALVRELLADAEVEVQWIFVNRAIARLLLAEAAAAGEDPALVARAAALFHQPSDGDPHDDHMHVRVYCAPADRALGCVDRGPVRWWKKRWKYMTASYRRAETAAAPAPDAGTVAPPPAAIAHRSPR